MVLTTMKTSFPKAVPKEIIYGDMKNLDKKALKRDLRENLKQADSTNYILFEEIFENVLDKAPKKKKMQGSNHKGLNHTSQKQCESHYETVRVSNKISHSTYRGK